MKYIILLLILINILIASRWIFDGNIFFHTDIARDFLLIEDIIDNKHITLIGPRSGAIPGLFHGPLWLYLNLPAFLIGGGNPVFVGWFWVGLYVLSITVTYWVGKKLFGEEEGRLSALLFSAVTILPVKSLFNPYGALLLSPIFLYFFISYLRHSRVKLLILSLFILGLIIQFQMAFGVPVLILTIGYLINYLAKKKKLVHIISLPILLIPLSTFILFDLRNSFIQLKSIMNYLNGSESHGKLNLDLLSLGTMRIKESVTEGLGILTQNNLYISILLFIVLISGVYLFYKKKDEEKLRPFYTLAILFYFGFWVFTIFFNGPVWNYYFLPFIPLLILIFTSLRKRVNSIFFYFLFSLIYLINVMAGIQDGLAYTPDSLHQDVSTWQFNKLVAEKIFTGDEKEFGYFIFTPDLYGYSPRYAMNYYQKIIKDKKVYPYQKRAITYLVIAPPPVYGKDPNSIWYQKNTNSALWKSNDIRITKEPESKVVFENGFIIEKYRLSDEEIKVEPNPYLIKDIFFR